MSEIPGDLHEDGGQSQYAIRIKGHLSASWLQQFDGMQAQHTESGETILTGCITDQAALHGLLRIIRDLGLELLAINRIDTE